MSAIEQLVEQFAKFPGIGPRQARRFVYFLLNKNSSYIQNLIQNIEHLKQNARTCSECQRHFIPDNPHNTLCDICIQPNRDHSKLMIVCRDADMSVIESHHVYEGHYFILGGTLTFFEQDPEASIRLSALKKHVTKKAQEHGLQEIIVAVNANPEGEHTAQFIMEELTDTVTKHNLTISTLARGLSTGSELEYADHDTFQSAFTNRSSKK